MAMKGDPYMNQNEIGRFLRKLRTEKGWTQSELADRLNVSNRSISRWENGATMPDLSLLLELSELYLVSVDEILRAGSEVKNMEENNVVARVADYSSIREAKVSRRLQYMFGFSILCMIGFMCIDINHLSDTEPYSLFAGLLLGFISGMLIIGFIYTSRYQKKISEAKRRLFQSVMKKK